MSPSPAKEGKVLISGSSRKVAHLSCSLNIFLDLDFFPGLVEKGATPSPKPCPSGSPTRWPSASTSPAWTEASHRSAGQIKCSGPWWTCSSHTLRGGSCGCHFRLSPCQLSLTTPPNIHFLRQLFS